MKKVQWFNNGKRWLVGWFDVWLILVEYLFHHVLVRWWTIAGSMDGVMQMGKRDEGR